MTAAAAAPSRKLGMPRQGKQSGGAANPAKFTIDCSKVVEDRVLDIASLEKFLHDRIKVGGRVNNLGDKVKISRDRNRLTIEASTDFSKRYLKFLTRKYLRRQQLHEYLRVLAVGKSNYTLRYFALAAGDEEDAKAE